jgi:hypothetical protein
MIQLDPEQLFRDWLEKNQEFNFRGLVAGTGIQNSLSAALASLAAKKPTAEELKGANRFIDIWLNLGEPPKPPAEFPNKMLDSSLMKPLDHTEKKPAP